MLPEHCSYGAGVKQYEGADVGVKGHDEDKPGPTEGCATVHQTGGVISIDFSHRYRHLSSLILFVSGGFGMIFFAMYVAY